MASNLNAYQIVGISLVITGALVGITASILSTWFIFSLRSQSPEDLMRMLDMLSFISRGGWVILYIGFFLLFWDIGKKIMMPESYTIIIVLILIMAIAISLVVIMEYILWVTGINVSPKVSIVFHDSIPVFTGFAALLTGIALLLLSQKKLNISLQ